MHAKAPSAWRLNSAPTGVRQRRQGVQMDLSHAKSKKQHNFFTGLREKKSSRALPPLLLLRRTDAREESIVLYGRAGQKAAVDLVHG